MINYKYIYNHLIVFNTTMEIPTSIYGDLYKFKYEIGNQKDTKIIHDSLIKFITELIKDSEHEFSIIGKTDSAKLVECLK